MYPLMNDWRIECTNAARKSAKINKNKASGAEKEKNKACVTVRAWPLKLASKGFARHRAEMPRDGRQAVATKLRQAFQEMLTKQRHVGAQKEQESSHANITGEDLVKQCAP